MKRETQIEARLLAYKKVASENTRLKHQNTERVEIHGSLGCATKPVI